MSQNASVEVKPSVPPVSLAEVLRARDRLQGLAICSPAIRCGGVSSIPELHLKLENLQPVGSFKVRPIGNAVLAKNQADLVQGVYTASSGNAALNLAWMARRMGVRATALVPEDTPSVKLERLRGLGARIMEL